jgi:hypothetical protein
MHETIETAAHVALLAPVPLEHLIDAKNKSDTESRVAFGSRVWELLAELDTLRKSMPVDLYRKWCRLSESVKALFHQTVR